MRVLSDFVVLPPSDVPPVLVFVFVPSFVVSLWLFPVVRPLAGLSAPPPQEHKVTARIHAIAPLIHFAFKIHPSNYIVKFIKIY